MKNVEKRLLKVIIDYGVDQSKISKDADYYFDLNLDILDLMGLANNIKNEFKVAIPDHEIMKMEKISDTIDFLKRKSTIYFYRNY
ncbi:MAG: acyl carrier protein [Thiohalospira sp.]